MEKQRVQPPVRALDVFCGAGGSSAGARAAGVDLVAAIDMWPLAKATYKDNFPTARFYCRKLEYVNPRQVLEEVGPIDLLLASPECTNHSCAKGNGERLEESRRTAFHVTRFARVLKPHWIVVENVVQMKSWMRYDEWISRLRRLGYSVREQTLNAAKFGVPQSRRRLFIICELGKTPPEVNPPANSGEHKAREVVSTNGNHRFSELRTKNRAKNTIARADRAIAKVGENEAFLLVYYGSDGAGGWQTLDAPLRTVTTLDRFAYVRQNGRGHEMRMLQVPELKTAMGFPDSYKFDHGTRRDKIRLLGNAVCPPVMSRIVMTLTRGFSAPPSQKPDGSDELDTYAQSKI
ncbi:MAG TPA: DNA cytosine methyltransferase [Terriglobia bacterium]|nr:DNA cytosine methyltransferase [Terriglobia bacterium]